MMIFCLKWVFIPASKNSDPCYQLFAERPDNSGKMDDVGYIIQDTSEYARDDVPFIIYAPAKGVIGRHGVTPVDKASSLFAATRLAVLHAIKVGQQTSR